MAKICAAIMPVMFPLTDVAVPPAGLVGRLFEFTIPIANYVRENRGFAARSAYDWAVLDTFDMLSPAFDQPQTAGEIERALGEGGLGRDAPPAQSRRQHRGPQASGRGRRQFAIEFVVGLRAGSPAKRFPAATLAAASSPVPDRLRERDRAPATACSIASELARRPRPASTPTLCARTMSATSPTPGLTITGRPQPSASPMRVGQLPSLARPVSRKIGTAPRLRMACGASAKSTP